MKNYAGCEEGVRGYGQAEGQLHHCTRNLQNFLGAKVGGIGFSGIGNFPCGLRFLDLDKAFFDFLIFSSVILLHSKSPAAVRS